MRCSCRIIWKNLYHLCCYNGLDPFFCLLYGKTPDYEKLKNKRQITYTKPSCSEILKWNRPLRAVLTCVITKIICNCKPFLQKFEQIHICWWSSDKFACLCTCYGQKSNANHSAGFKVAIWPKNIFPLNFQRSFATVGVLCVKMWYVRTFFTSWNIPRSYYVGKYIVLTLILLQVHITSPSVYDTITAWFRRSSSDGCLVFILQLVKRQKKKSECVIIATVANGCLCLKCRRVFCCLRVMHFSR